MNIEINGRLEKLIVKENLFFDMYNLFEIIIIIVVLL